MTIEEILKIEGVYVSTTAGVSMYPMLRNRRDTIIISTCEGRLKRFDVPLYRRGNDYVLHRIIYADDTNYIIRGDNCYSKEYNVTDEKIIGVLTGFYRGNKMVNMDGFGYKAYVRIWHALYPIRYVFWRGKGILRRILKGAKN